MIVAKIAFRNIFRQKRRSILTGLTIAGGFVLCSLSIAMSDGMYGHVIDLFTRLHTGHVQIHKRGYLEKPSLYNTLSDADKIGEEISKIKGIEAWAPRIYAPALAFAGTKTTGVKIIGIDPVREKETTTLAKNISTGAWISEKANNEVMLGSGLADILKIGVGDEVVLISQASDGSVANDIFKVSALVGKSSNSMERMNCYMHIATAQAFLELENRVHEIALVDGHYSNSFMYAEKIKSVLKNKDIDVEPWQIVEAQFYKSMQADVEGMWYSLFVVVLLVGLGVLNTVLMTILERTREYGLLKAVGTKPTMIFNLIMLESIFLALISTAIGIVLSLAVNYYFSIYGIKYPEPMTVGGMEITMMQTGMSLRSYIIPAIATMLTAMLVSIWPAIRATRVAPVKALMSH